MRSCTITSATASQASQISSDIHCFLEGYRNFNEKIGLQLKTVVCVNKNMCDKTNRFQSLCNDDVMSSYICQKNLPAPSYFYVSVPISKNDVISKTFLCFRVRVWVRAGVSGNTFSPYYKTFLNPGQVPDYLGIYFKRYLLSDLI